MTENPIKELLEKEAVNVVRFKQREKLLARLRKLRAAVVLDINTIEYWNKTHPEEIPISTDFEYAVLAFYDGKGPMPMVPE